MHRLYRSMCYIATIMEIKIKRFDISLPLPEYKTDLAAGLDVAAREETVIKPQEVVLVPLNFAIEIPKTHFVLMTARSSLHKRGLMLANGVGIGDADFSGDNDEYHAPLLNFSNKKAVVERGERVGQIIVLERNRVELTEVDHLGNDDRGGFGSTGRV